MNESTKDTQTNNQPQAGRQADRQPREGGGLGGDDNTPPRPGSHSSLSSNRFCLPSRPPPLPSPACSLAHFKIDIEEHLPDR
mmetsp:Transcript_10892/g.31596  ORF Transcript_10892/g.31596 Transcript_10892/m.31596 type:complete len:82 (-) Transcript_10892:201-446(-)